MALSYVAKQTPSSMHSLYELRELIGRSPFVLTTVDTVFREEEFGRYVKDFKRVADSGGALIGVTDHVDDEKPLYVESPLPSSPRRGGDCWVLGVGSWQLGRAMSGSRAVSFMVFSFCGFVFAKIQFFFLFPSFFYLWLRRKATGRRTKFGNGYSR